MRKVRVELERLRFPVTDNYIHRDKGRYEAYLSFKISGAPGSSVLNPISDDPCNANGKWSLTDGLEYHVDAKTWK